MTTKRPMPPTVKLRRLAAELRRLRATAEMSREHVGERTGINEATLYRIETARARPQKRTLLALLDLYGVADPQRADLLAVSQNADRQGWLRPYHSELPEEYNAYVSFEAEARSVRNYESLYIPGLLQTEDYARAMFKGCVPTASQKEVEQRVQSRMERQALLSREHPLQLWAIVDEAAIRRLVGGLLVMQAQAQHLMAMVEEPHVVFQVVAFDQGAHPGMPGSFVHMDFDDQADPELVYVETMAADLFLESEADVRSYKSMFEHLRAVALSPDETGHLVAMVAQP